MKAVEGFSVSPLSSSSSCYPWGREAEGDRTKDRGSNFIIRVSKDYLPIVSDIPLHKMHTASGVLCFDNFNPPTSSFNATYFVCLKVGSS